MSREIRGNPTLKMFEMWSTALISFNEYRIQTIWCRRYSIFVIFLC